MWQLNSVLMNICWVLGVFPLPMSLEMIFADELPPALRLPTSQVVWLLPVMLQFAMVREPMATVRTLDLPVAGGPLMIVLNTVQ